MSIEVKKIRPGKIECAEAIERFKDMDTNIKSIIDDLSSKTLACPHCLRMIPRDKAIQRNDSLYHEGELYKLTHFNCPLCNSWMDTIHEKSSIVSKHFDNETLINIHTGKVEPKLGLDNDGDVEEPLRNSAKNYQEVYKRKSPIDNNGDIKPELKISDEAKQALITNAKPVDIEPIPVPDVKELLLKTVKSIIEDTRNEIKASNDKCDECVYEKDDRRVECAMCDDEVDKKGFVIVIEGADGSGKQTQSTLLKDKLNEMGIKTSLFSFPNYESLAGKMVSEYLRGDFNDQSYINNSSDPIYRNAMLYSIDRMYACMVKDEEGKTIIDRYNEGEVIIFDRYTQSNFIHQGIHFQSDYELGKFVGDLEYIEYHVMGLPRPDMTIYLKVNPETSLNNIDKRGNQKDIHENLEHLHKVSNHIHRIIDHSDWDVIPCDFKTSHMFSNPDDVKYQMKHPDTIHNDILGLVKPALIERGLYNCCYCTNCFDKTRSVIGLEPIKIVNDNVKKYSLASCPRCNSIYNTANL